MLKILRVYEKDGFEITELTEDGKNVAFTEAHRIIDIDEIESSQATIEEQILVENQYQTALLELQMLGGV